MMKRILYFAACLMMILAACKKPEDQMKTFEQIIAEKACLTCDDFTTQLEAKTYVNTLKPECYAQLSPNQDSVFCPNLPESGAAINYADCKNCSDFDNEEQAKAHADTTQQCRFLIDPNRNGIYCEKGEGSFKGGGHGGG